MNLESIGILFLTGVGLYTAGIDAASGAEGHEIGNGGGAWVCKNADLEGTVRWAQLVDLYEGRNEFELTIPT
ncbi:MAG: hypothetical protein AAB425_14650, partial [Bdellovibrionota bacterium]